MANKAGSEPLAQLLQDVVGFVSGGEDDETASHSDISSALKVFFTASRGNIRRQFQATKRSVRPFSEVSSESQAKDMRVSLNELLRQGSSIAADLEGLRSLLTAQLAASQQHLPSKHNPPAETPDNQRGDIREADEDDLSLTDEWALGSGVGSPGSLLEDFEPLDDWGVTGGDDALPDPHPAETAREGGEPLGRDADDSLVTAELPLGPINHFLSPWSSEQDIERWPPYPGALPSSALTSEEYRSRLEEMPCLWIHEHRSFPSDSAMMPDLRQDKKDLERDVISVNGQVLKGGDVGYGGILATLADCILSSSGSLEGDGETRSVWAELRACVLLHIVNRTWAGGYSLEKVVDVYDSAPVFIVPDSKSADPLEISILDGSKLQEKRAASSSPPSTALYAILKSPMSFNLLYRHDTTDTRAHASVASVKSCLIVDLNLATQLPNFVLEAVGEVLRDQLEGDSALEGLLSPMLAHWLRDRAGGVPSRKGSVHIHSRIQLEQLIV